LKKKWGDWERLFDADVKRIGEKIKAKQEAIRAAAASKKAATPAHKGAGH